MFVRFVTRILLVALVLLVVAEYIPGIEVLGIYPAIIAALVLGVLNAIVRPILVVLTLPVTIITLGLFLFVINASLFWFAASFIDGFSVSGFWSALIGSLLVSLVGLITNKAATTHKQH